MHTLADATFTALLADRFPAGMLDAHPSSVFGIWPDGRLAYLNPGWYEFAIANGGYPAIENQWDIGANYLDAVTPPLRPFYRALLARAPEVGAAQHPLSHEYECSSADMFRKYNMQVYALPRQAGWLVVNSLVVEQPHDPEERPAHATSDAEYRDVAGIVHQCAHCRRVLHQGREPRWDWVPAWVTHPARDTSHDVCPVCYAFYYPQVASSLR